MFYETDYRYVVIKAHPAVLAEIQAMTKPNARLIPEVFGKEVYLLPCDNMHMEHLEVEGARSVEELKEMGAYKLVERK